MLPLKLIVCGSGGRMGREISALCSRDRRFSIVAKVARKPKGRTEITEAELPKTLRSANVLIDFTEPAASIRFAELSARSKKPIVIGTTGFSAAQRLRIKKLSRKTAIFLSPNFSLGMNVIFQLAEQAAKTLSGYRPVITEVHHVHKKDVPSGTALRLAEYVQKAAGRKVSITSRREGQVVGKHVLRLTGPFETIELGHSARSRTTFAAGALEAARWLSRQRPGLYDMRSLLK